ncbi:kinase-like domain-containing protein, partial [Hyaloraphidium curvatum]
EHAAAGIVSTLLLTLAYLHDRGVVHRDVKASNVIVRDTRHLSSLALVDFGCAYCPGARPRTRDNGPDFLSTIVGTPFYLPPEIGGGAESYTAKVDVWSTGCLAFELLFGFTPFQDAESYSDLYRRISTAEFAFPEDRPVSDDAKDFIRGALCVDQSTRPSAAEALAHPWI